MNRRWRAAVALLGIAAGSVLAAFGARDIGLRQTDCVACRRIFALVLRPDDLNAPIAQVRIDGAEAEFAVFPTYVGHYVLEY